MPTLLISGASSGIGREVALQAARQGTTVLVLGRRAALLDELAAETGGRCIPIPVDVSDTAAAQRAVDRAVEATGRIDAALLNVGAGPSFNLAGGTAAEILHTMDANYRVTVNMLVPLIAVMKRQRSGLIVHTNSLAGVNGTPMQGPYSAAKAACRLLIDTARIELKPYGVRLMSVYPGFVATDRVSDDGLPKPFEISAADAAARILRAMRGRRPDVLFPAPTATLVRALRMLPKSVAGRIMLRFTPPEY
ncbi:NAD(P)-dependent dehydrogenase (short-subunit alcohol dehydrogenase family) [Actinoplanes tereljensis]|uniref:SDR family NAD(P)-dependent oxidoreductase n=1 Tax=Paractinoplanes tereljensis TaxID=571912 RepID=UPI0019447455|nr:SDR family oxidoreductase [Actinoplanes tereljensis]